ncbi:MULTISPECIES: LysE family translocator [Vibrio]|uniref:Putative amino acid transporter n=1 Tax=Vibrio halioticoli NBRC 102217 TaxID=1219072 RepID=V5FDJ9_9VIBR|nr:MULTISPECIES: LysE family translocator [Vibrio]MPW37383.1 LysE family translocator [Vibrio sp. B1Z05]GAD89713.1 putative amino acid transporter [Vibrio halioticoli NBRC 102217]
MELFSAILLFAFSSTITPGPNNIMMMTSGMNYGVKRSLPHFMGICIGFPTMVVAIGLGLGSLFQWFPTLHDIIKVLGIVYLLYLAWKIASAETDSLSGEKAKPFTFLQGALFQWVNPKAWIMATGAVAAFTSDAMNIYTQVGLIAGLFLLVAFPCVGMWLVFGSKVRLFLSDPKHQKIFNVCMAILLVLSIVPVVLEYL